MRHGVLQCYLCRHFLKIKYCEHYSLKPIRIGKLTKKKALINNNVETAIKKNNYSQQYKKHILSILQEDKIGLTEEFKNELFTIILKEA